MLVYISNVEECVVAKDYSNNMWRNATILKRRSSAVYTMRTDDNRLEKTCGSN